MRGRKRKLPENFTPAPWVGSSEDEDPQAQAQRRRHHVQQPHPPHTGHTRELRDGGVRDHAQQHGQLLEDEANGQVHDEHGEPERLQHEGGHRVVGDPEQHDGGVPDHAHIQGHRVVRDPEQHDGDVRDHAQQHDDDPVPPLLEDVHIREVELHQEQQQHEHDHQDEIFLDDEDDNFLADFPEGDIYDDDDQFLADIPEAEINQENHERQEGESQLPFTRPTISQFLIFFHFSS